MNKSLALAHFQTSFQFITHQNERFSYLEGAYLALIGGCDWVQLRMKGATDEEVEPIARKLKLACEGAGATFILDDRVELVKKLQIDGVHLGKNDMPVDEARKLLGDEFIIGGTANTFDDIRRLHEQGADYIGCGPFRYTTTKEKLSPVLGIEGYRQIIEQMRENKISLPMVAIGGLTPDDIDPLAELGIGVAMSGTILNAENPVTMTRQIHDKCFGLFIENLNHILRISRMILINDDLHEKREESFGFLLFSHFIVVILHPHCKTVASQLQIMNLKDMKLIVGIYLGNIGKTDAVGKNENIMIYAPSHKGA